jgi:hypothetical protein
VLAADLLSTNLTSPIVLSFALGLVASLLRSDLRFPDSVTSLLSTYLLFAIGLKGGRELAHSTPSDIVAPALAAVGLALVASVATYAVGRRVLRLGAPDAAALAAHYGSVSAVTFTAAESFATTAGTLAEGYFPALVALMEFPGIVLALLLVARSRASGSLAHTMREVVRGKSVVLLVGGIAVGLVTTDAGYDRVAPLFATLFPGVLCLFLIDLGTLAGQHLVRLRPSSARVAVYAIVAPVVLGALGVVVGLGVGLSVGGAGLLGAMAASASYIAAPAAVRVGLPGADLGTALLASLGITFPFNLVLGIPLYAEIAARLG